MTSKRDYQIAVDKFDASYDAAFAVLQVDHKVSRVTARDALLLAAALGVAEVGRSMHIAGLVTARVRYTRKNGYTVEDLRS